MLLFVTIFGSPAAWASGVFVHGKVFDINGNALRKVAVTLTRPPAVPGPYATTVFTGDDGSFAFPSLAETGDVSQVTVQAHAIGYRQVGPSAGPAKLSAFGSVGNDRTLVLVLQPVANEAAAAPPSAWLKQVPNSDPTKELLIRECVSCHQFPQPEAFDLARAMADDPISASPEARKADWKRMFDFMFFASGLSYMDDGVSGRTSHLQVQMQQLLDPAKNRYYEPLSNLLTKYMVPDRLQRIRYDYGAPLAVTSATTINEYTIPARMYDSSIHEAALFGNPLDLWVADMSLGRLYRIDPATGRAKILPVPIPGEPGVVSYGPGGYLYIGFVLSNVFGRVSPNGHFTVMRVKKADGKDFPPLFMADMALGADRQVHFDSRGRLWFIEGNTNGLLEVDPRTGVSKLYPTNRLAPGSTNDDTNLYALVITSDRKHLWYTQLGYDFGEFNTETGKYETEVKLPPYAGPRRLAITEKDILYVPLFGAGQILEYDARARKQIGLYDVPDRAAAPYVVAWDKRRQVLWVGTANGNVIYRFDPKTKTFGVIPMPRMRGFLRQIWIEPHTGLLVTAYSFLPQRVPGPRMALVINPGDVTSDVSTSMSIVINTGHVASRSASVPQAVAPHHTTALQLETLLENAGCDACHSLNQVRIGPPMLAISARYSHRPREEMEAVLASKILYGGAGNWGALPMIANKIRINRTQAVALAHAILDLQPASVETLEKSLRRPAKGKMRNSAH